ncbi:MAG: glycosyltransferase [Bacteroidia bacterium]
MSSEHIHLVSFDVPFPPSYGGVIDVFYKLKALKAFGMQVHLHCFQYGREASKELESVCASVHYYPRRTQKHLLFGKQPYIVSTRKVKALLENLLRDDYPILFEGLHCCAFLDDPRLKKRLKLVRTHNIEHDYYDSLAAVENGFFKKLYFKREAKKLRAFESVLTHANQILAISPADAKSLASRFKQVNHVMAFHAYSDVVSETGRGNFALYHGNLEVGENNQAALFLVREVFSTLDIDLVIAGNNPSAELQEAVALQANCSLKANIEPEEIDRLISSAQINVLPTFQATGIKLKLLAALFRGRHCVVNPPMVANTGLESACVVAETALMMKLRLLDMYEKPFTAEDILARKRVLGKGFSNELNAAKIIHLLK